MAEKNLFDDLEANVLVDSVALASTQETEPSGRNLFDDLEADAPRTSVPAPEEDDEGVIESVGRGIVTAPISLAQGIVELGAIGLDSAFDTDTLRPVTDWFEDVKENIAPEGTAGKVAEEVLAFGIGFVPIAGWVGRAGQVARTGRAVGAKSKFMKSAETFGNSTAGKKLLSTKGGMYATTALGAGVYEGFVSPSGRETLSDSASFFPDVLKTEDYQGQVGSGEAGRQFRNKLRNAAEAAALSAGFDTLAYGLGEGGRQVAKIPGVAPTLSAGARGITNVFDFVALNTAKVPGAARSKQLFDRYFSSTKGADPAVAASIRDAQGLTTAEKNEAVRSVTKYTNAVKKAAKAVSGRNNTKAFMAEANQDSYNFLVGLMPEDLMRTKYGDEVVGALNEAALQGSRIDDTHMSILEESLRKEQGRFKSAATSFAPGLTLPRERAINQGLANIEEVKKMQKDRKMHMTRIFQLHQNPVQYFKELGPDFMESKEFSEAVDDVIRFNMKSSPGSTPTPQARKNAADTVLETINLSAISRGEDPAKAIKQALKMQKGAMNKLVNESKPLLKISEEMLIGRKPLISESPALRAFMGEIDDTATILTETLNRTVENTEALRFFRDVMAPGSKGGAEGVVELLNGKRPMAVTVPNPFRLTPEEFQQEVQGLSALKLTPETLETALRDDFGYKKLGEFDESSAYGGRFGEMSGKYVPEEIYASLTAPVTLSSHPVSQLAAIVNQAKGLSQKMLIVPNLASRMRDILGNALMRVATGNAPSFYNQNNLGAAQLFFRDASNLNDEGLERMRLMLDASGVTESNVMLNRIQELQAEGPSVGASGAVRKGIKFYESLPGQKQILKFFEGITDSVDGYSKATVMLGEQAKLDQMFKGANIVSDEEAAAVYDWMQRSNLAKRTRSESLTPIKSAGGAPKRKAVVELTQNEVIAAERAKAFMPTYGELGDLVTAVDRTLPFGNFTSFASENIRNITNIFTQALRELSAVADEGLIAALGKQRADAFVRMTRAEGLQRMVGLASVATMVPKAMVRASMNATGTTDEQMDRLHENVADYLDGHDLVILDNDGKGSYEWMDLSYVAPYSFVTDAVTAAIRTYQEKGRLDASEADQLASAAWSSISSLADPFASESIVFERVRDALPSEGFPGVGRGGVTSMGSRIYEENDDLGTKVQRGFTHIMDSLAPAYLKLATEGKKGEIEPGRLSRAMMNTPGARGQDYNSYEELARQVTGFTPMKLNLRQDFEFVGKEYSPKRSSLKTQANRSILRADNTPADMIEGWNKYLDGLYRVQSELYNHIQGARTLGLSEQEIMRNLVSKAKLGSKEVSVIMQGKFYPGTAAKETLESVVMQAQEGRTRLTGIQDIPIREFGQLSASRMMQPLSPELFRKRQSEVVDAASPSIEVPTTEPNLFDSVQEAAPAAPATGPVPVPAAPQAPQAPAATTPPSPSLLGGNLIDQLRNSEIAQRLSGQ